MQHIKTPVDLLSLPCITPANVQQAIDTAYPFPNQGFIIWADTAPDTVADPILRNFFWGLTVGGVKPINSEDLEVYFFNGTSWELIPLQVLPGSIQLTDIDLDGSLPFYIIQVNAGGTALQWISIPNAIQDNTIPPAKLLVQNNVDSFILTSFAGTKAFTEIAAFFAAIADGTIPVSKLTPGAADALRQVLTTNVAGTAVEWTRLDIANIGAIGSAPNQGVRRNAGNTAWEFYTPPVTSVVSLTNSGAYWAVPAGGSVIAIPHAQSAIPGMVRVVLRCAVATVDGYLLDDELDLFSVTCNSDGTDQYCAFSVATDATNITVGVLPLTGGPGLFSYFPKAGGAVVTFASANWLLKAYIIA